MGGDRIRRNLSLYAKHQVAASLYFWFPTSILYFLSRFGLSAALQLGAVYFLSVVVVEVPSGWFSDRVGRVITLRVAALGFAGLSRTDASFHFDTLESLKSTGEVGDHGAAASRNQIRECLAYLQRRGLAWVFLFLTLQQPLEGLAFDLIQPWLADLTEMNFVDSGPAPLLTLRGPTGQPSSRSGVLLAVLPTALYFSGWGRSPNSIKFWP